MSFLLYRIRKSGRGTLNAVAFFGKCVTPVQKQRRRPKPTPFFFRLFFFFSFFFCSNAKFWGDVEPNGVREKSFSVTTKNRFFHQFFPSMIFFLFLGASGRGTESELPHRTQFFFPLLLISFGCVRLFQIVALLTYKRLFCQYYLDRSSDWSKWFIDLHKLLFCTLDW